MHNSCFFKLVHTGYKEQPGAAWH